MPVETPEPAGSPLMHAWEAYKEFGEFKNTRRWAVDRDHVDGSLWAAFSAGFRAVRGGEIERLRAALGGLVASVDSYNEWCLTVRRWPETVGEKTPLAVAKAILKGSVCEHDWHDATNEVVTGGEVCLKCHEIRATPSPKDTDRKADDS